MVLEAAGEVLNLRLLIRNSLTLVVALCIAGCRTSTRGADLTLRDNPATSRIRFEEIAVKAGIRYRWSLPGAPPHNILQTIGNGCAFLDYDSDGRLDVLLVGPGRLALYKGNGLAGFTDVTESAGLSSLRGHFLGCAVGDYDNDGFDDVYISGYRTGALLKNVGGAFFRDLGAQLNIPAQPWGTSASFADLDADGFLDLFICNYVDFGPKSKQFCLVKGVPVTCGPGVYPKLRSKVFRNLAGKRFVDATAKWSMWTSGNSLGAAAADYDRSGRLDLAVANDALPGDLFQNQGRGRLMNLGVSSGTAYSRDGRTHAGMGVDWGDYDNDGLLDLFVTTFSLESKCLYRNRGSVFSEESAATGIDAVMKPFVSFGCKFADFDNDGWLDIVTASGHVWDNPEPAVPGLTVRQPVKLLRSNGPFTSKGMSFADVSEAAGIDRYSPILGRGLSVGDFDNDGKSDVLIVDNDGAPLLLHNRTRHPGNWIGIRFVGGSSNRNAYGAVVTARAGGRLLTRHCHSDGSYMSASDSRLRIGLGDALRAEEISVRWPSGRRTALKNVLSGRYITMREAELEE